MDSHNPAQFCSGKGARHALSMPEEAEIIRRLKDKDNKVSKSALAREKGVHRNTVLNIWNRYLESQGLKKKKGRESQQ